MFLMESNVQIFVMNSVPVTYTQKKCKECFARFYCSGGCPANSYNFHGTINNSCDCDCDMERKTSRVRNYDKAALADTEGEEK